MFEGVKNILVLKLRHVGDVLLTVPAIRALKENFPGSRVSALVNSGTEEMLTLNPLLDGVFCYDRSLKKKNLAERALGEIRLVKELRKKRFDMTVDLTSGDRPALVGYLTGARYRLAYEPEGSGFAGKKFLYTHVARRPSVRVHTVLRDLMLLKGFGLDTLDLTVDIYASREDESEVERILSDNGVGLREPFVHVHPTSRWLFKCWTDEGMAGIMDMLQSRGLRAVVTASPDEEELKKVRSVIKLMKTVPVDLSGKLRLKQLAGLSRRSAFFFGVDTAPMHIAAAAGARVVGIFGPSGAFDWGPWDNGEVPKLEVSGALTPYPKTSGVQVFGKNTVIQKGWDCIPCGRAGCNDTRKSDCLDSLSVKEVWEVLERYVNESGSSHPDGRARNILGRL